MRFVFFTKGAMEVPSSRYRAFYLAEALTSLRHQASVIPVVDTGFRALFRYIRLLLSTNSTDIRIFQRTVYNKWFTAAVLITLPFRQNFIFDIDDAVYEHSLFNSVLFARLARGITCGSEHIIQWARQHNQNTFLLLNGLPLSVYTIRNSEPKELTIGWIGNGPAHYENLAFLVPILIKLADKGHNFTFKLIGAVGDIKIHELFENVPFPVEIIDALDWADPRYVVAEIHTFTIGVMPLTETTWNQAKYFKALEYMSCGVPVIASSADTLSRIFAEAGCGTLVQTEGQWVDAFERLLSDRALRMKEGKCGRLYVEKEHSSITMARSLVSFIKNDILITRNKIFPSIIF